jgi:Fic family protein
MESGYNPQFKITGRIVNLVAEIAEALTRLSFVREEDLRLRRINRIATIHGSLAIEGNTLSVEQITAILDNKPVIGSPREIQEVRNAITAYESLDKWNAYSLKDLLEAHKVLMAGLIDDAGTLRRGGVGVFAGDEVIHIAPPPRQASILIAELLNWLEHTAEHPLTAAAVFHYEFEFIHPFSDGNGRLGRLWQTLILSRWNKLFAQLPIESLIHKQQADYYNALRESTKKTDCGVFIEFILEAVHKAINIENHEAAPEARPEATPEATPEVERLLMLLADGMMLSRTQLQQKLGLKDEKNMRSRYIIPALKGGLIEQTIPDKPQSPRQKYRITDKGRGVVGRI